MVKIYLIRHGQTVFNAEHKISGQIETELTSLGKEQAQTLAKKLKNKGININSILCSTLKRAKDTAQIISKETKTPIVYDKNLQEFHNGIFEGIKVEDMQKMQFNPPYKTAGFEFSNGADLYAAYSSFDPKYDKLSYPQGETKQQACNRFMTAIKNYLDHNPDIKTLAVVAHGAVIRFMLLKICPETVKEKIKNTEAKIIFYNRNSGTFSPTE